MDGWPQKIGPSSEWRVIFDGPLLPKTISDEIRIFADSKVSRELAEVDKKNEDFSRISLGAIGIR
jgi:hypothetical protein